MEAITFISFFCAIFFGYFANANNNEIRRLKNYFREREFEVQYLLDEKEREVSNLKRQVQTEKNKLLNTPSVNKIELLSLKEQLDKNRVEIKDLQRKIFEKEKAISDLRNENSSLNLKSENELQNFRRQLAAMQNDSNEIYILRNKNYEQQDKIQTLNEILSHFKNENDELKLKIEHLKSELEIHKKNTVTQGTLFTPVTENTPPKKFVRVIFSKGSNKFFDYRLGDNPDVKVGDFVMVSFYNKKIKKSDVTAAQVIYISRANEFSKNATSPIIGKAAYPKW